MKQKTQRLYFKVRGNGEFPHDMLRYDGCKAASPEDQAKIDWTYDDPVPPGTGHLYRREVTLVVETGHRWFYPTVDRWRSFTWSCDPVAEPQENPHPPGRAVKLIDF